MSVVEEVTAANTALLVAAPWVEVSDFMTKAVLETKSIHFILLDV